jgi:hypothetical protein
MPANPSSQAAGQAVACRTRPQSRSRPGSQNPIGRGRRGWNRRSGGLPASETFFARLSRFYAFALELSVEAVRAEYLMPVLPIETQNSQVLLSLQLIGGGF